MSLETSKVYQLPQILGTVTAGAKHKLANCPPLALFGDKQQKFDKPIKARLQRYPPFCYILIPASNKMRFLYSISLAYKVTVICAPEKYNYSQLNFKGYLFLSRMGHDLHVLTFYESFTPNAQLSSQLFTFPKATPPEYLPEGKIF